MPFEIAQVVLQGPTPVTEQAAWSWLVPLPVTLPLIGAGLTLVASRSDRYQRLISTSVLMLVLAASGVLLWVADTIGPRVVQVGGWPAPMGVTLVVDRLSALMVLISVIVTLGVLLYSIGQGRSSDDQRDGEAPLPIFHPTLMIMNAGVSTTFISGDLFHMYVGFEMLLVASFVLLTVGGTEDRVQAGVNYTIVNLLSSVFFLAALAFIYSATGTVNLAQVSVRMGELPESTAVTLSLLLLLGFAVKAAIFPLMGWLPDSYPTAPAPVTAVFAGLLTKVGVYAIIRTSTLFYPEGGIAQLLLWGALLTMLFGILGAIAQDDIKRLFSFTLVSHIGYMIFGIAIGNTVGLSGAIFYVAHHIVVQTSLFLVTGLIEYRTGTTSLAELGGLARTAPVLAVMFFIPAINLAGVPPFSGWLGKVALLEGGAEAGTWLGYLLIAATVLTSLLTLYAVSRVWSRAFWRRPVTEMPMPSRPEAGAQVGATAYATSAPNKSAGFTNTSVPAAEVLPVIDPERLEELQRNANRPIPRGMLVPTLLLVLVSVGFTFVAGPLYGITDRAAVELLDTGVYIDAVFPEGVP